MPDSRDARDVLVVFCHRDAVEWCRDNNRDLRSLAVVNTSLNDPARALLGIVLGEIFYYGQPSRGLHAAQAFEIIHALKETFQR